VTKALLMAGFGGCETLSEEGPEVNLQNQAIYSLTHPAV
jgi:hypothetical protein